jgi:hypothetical protein
MALAYPSLRVTTSRQPPRPKAASTRQNAKTAQSLGDEESAAMLRQVADRMDTKRAEMSRFQNLCVRWDNLYYPDSVTAYGPDHWPEDPNLVIPGRAHVSLNAYPVYVDVPASLQSTVPIENITAADPRQEMNRELAAAVERVFFAWKEQVSFDIKAHKACVTKGLYGRTAAKVWWDEDLGMPQFSVVDQPKDLWLGWASSDYNRLEWAVYVQRMDPVSILEKYGVEVDLGPEGYPIVHAHGSYLTQTSVTGRDWLTGDESSMIEVIDYWYRLPKDTPKKGEPTEMVTYNCIIVGNCLVKDEKHEEYAGQLPYVPLFNTYIPGVPDGRSEFYDIEQLLREKDERISAGAQMVQKAVAGQFWQLTGQEAPDKVPAGVEPKPDKVIAPGAGNRVEKIEPWMPEFQWNDYLDRIDRELADVSGLNDLLRGLAPAQVLSSSKAINALVANYEARIAMKRDLFYVWRRAVWELAVDVWSDKNEELGAAFEQASRLVIKAPSLTPRDDIETSTMAANLVNAKLWSLRRGQDTVGVEDPEAEIDIIKEERTDASLFPADVQVQAALMSQMQQLQMQAAQMQPAGPPGLPPGGGTEAPLDQLAMQAAMMAPGGSPMMNGAGEQAVMPPEGLTPGAPTPGGGPLTGPDFNAVNQTMVKGGEAQNRLMLQQPLGVPQGPPEEAVGGAGLPM